MLYVDRENKMVETFSKVSEWVKQTSVLVVLLMASGTKEAQEVDKKNCVGSVFSFLSISDTTELYKMVPIPCSSSITQFTFKE